MKEKKANKANKAKVIKYYDDLYLIVTKPDMIGFEDFLGAWIFKSEHKTFLIDPGPSSTINQIKEALNELDIKKIDYILLSHIHIDHAGGAGDLTKAFPESFVVSHKTAVSHLENPEKLWKGSVKVLKEKAFAYGKIKPISKERLITAEDFSSKSVSVKQIITPGHATHHISFAAGDYLFAGETAGVCLCLNEKYEYVRPSTPPQFFLEQAINSIDKLIAIDPEIICYAHLGLKNEAVKRLKNHKTQIFLWKDIIEKEMRTYGNSEIFFSNCLKKLFKKDAELAGFKRLPKDIQKREEFFMINSIKGFAGYLQ